MELTTNKRHNLNILRRGSKYIFATLICLLLPVISNAALTEHQMQVDFSFDTQAIPGKQIAGYRLYKEGNLECETGPVVPQSISCTIASNTGVFAFTLSAIFDDGYESPQSAPFNFAIHDESSAIKGLQVLTGMFPTDIGGLGTVAGNSVVDLADVIHLLRQAAQ